jgi:hypothetical protein
MKTKHVVILGALVLLGACDKVQKQFRNGPVSMSIYKPSSSGKKVLILWGQSNAMGTGQGATVFEDRANVTYAGYHTGPIYYAGLKLAERFPKWDLTIVDCTAGGTQIKFFMPGEGNYEACRAKVLQQMRGGAELVGLMAYQGESDGRETYDPEWKDKFTSIMQNYREDFGTDAMPGVFAQLGMLSGQPPHDLVENWSNLKAEQTKVRISNSRMIKTDDQPVIDDVHHGYGANIVIGERFYNAYLSLIN